MQANIDWSQFFLSPHGRINRELWWFGILALFFSSLTGAALFGSNGGVVINLILLWPYLCLHIKRCHDRDKSAWWCLLFCMPLVALFWAIVDLGLLEGTRGNNRYGPDPLKGAG